MDPARPSVRIKTEPKTTAPPASARASRPLAPGAEEDLADRIKRSGSEHRDQRSLLAAGTWERPRAKRRYATPICTMPSQSKPATARSGAGEGAANTLWNAPSESGSAIAAASRLPSAVEGIASARSLHPVGADRSARLGAGATPRARKKSPPAAPKRVAKRVSRLDLADEEERQAEEREEDREHVAPLEALAEEPGGQQEDVCGAGVLEEDRVGRGGELGRADEAQDHRGVHQRGAPARAAKVGTQHDQIEGDGDRRTRAGDGKPGHRGELDEEAARRPEQRGARDQGCTAPVAVGSAGSRCSRIEPRCTMLPTG